MSGQNSCYELEGKPVQYNAENNLFYRANAITFDPVVSVVA